MAEPIKEGSILRVRVEIQPTDSRRGVGSTHTYQGDCWTSDLPTMLTFFGELQKLIDRYTT